ncbi:MAG: hypothetical protein KJ955_03475 [Nanoarchaeota archaeon]|nr:hypothetical protein [Nanoarchaeota archaeon]
MHTFKTKNYTIISSNKISKDIKSKCAKSYKKNRVFFKTECKGIKIRIANTETEFKKLASKFYQPWVKGVGLKGNFVAIRSPQLYENCYKKHGGTRKFELLLTHELNHIFAHKLKLYSGPYWFTEGMAMYVAGQVPGKEYTTPFKISADSLFYRLDMKKLRADMYGMQYLAVKELISRYGKLKLLKLIRLYRKGMKKAEYERKFKSIYGVSYEWFIENLLKKLS